MATGVSGGHFSPENENFCRYFRLVNETGVKPLRKILENEATGRKMTVKAFLGAQKTTMNILKQRGKIQKHQFDMIYPSTGNFQFENLDISVLCCIIKNTCKISGRGRTAAENIRMARNDICHNPVTFMSRLDYDTKFLNIQNDIKSLLKECQDANFETDIEIEMKSIDESPISVSSTLRLFEQFLVAQSSVQVLDINEKLDEVRCCETVVYERVRDLYARVDKQPKMTADAVEKVLRHVSYEQPRVNPMIEALLKQTEAVLKEKSDFVVTKQFKEAEKKLLSSGSVIISGGAGEGKTYTAYEILRRNGQGNNCIQINSPSDVRFLDPRTFDFVFIDDIFGNHEVDESKLQSWIHVMENLQQLVNARALYLIIATREIVLNECKKSIEKFSIFNNTMPLCSKNLSQREKQEILSAALKSRNKQCSSELIQQCVLAFSSDLGFPYTCTLFASDDGFIRDGVSFFKRNPFMSCGIFTQLNKCKQLSLLFLWIKDGTVPVALNRSEENDRILRNLSRILKYEKAIDIIYDDVNEHCQIMDGVFVTVKPDGYQIAHNTVYQSIGYHFARIGLYALIIEHSNMAFFMECISVTEFHYRSDRVFIRREFYQHIVDRVINEVTYKKHHREMAMHPCLTREILGMLIETLKKKKRFDIFFLSGVSSTNNSGYNSFLAFYLESCANESCWLVQQIQSQLKLSKISFKSKREHKVRNMYLEACHGACRGGNVDGLNSVLRFAKRDKTLLLDAAYSGNIHMYENVIQKLEPKEIKLHEAEALLISVEKQDTKMYTVIRKCGCMPDSKCLLIAAKAKNSEMLVQILVDMHISDVLKEDMNVRYIKSTLFSMEVFNALEQVGMCPKKEDIVRSMATNKKAVDSILWDLKYIHNENARKLTVKRRLSQLWTDLIEDPDLNEKLEEIGVLETSAFLYRQIKKGNIETVDEVLKHMTRNNDWDSNSNFAVNLLNSCLPSNIDMFEFLLNRGTIPHYTTLYRSVSTGNVDVVKLTVNKMKGAGSFDATHTCSKRALLQSIFFSDIYNFLIGEGMNPTAYHFLFAVECNKSTELTIKAIENLYSVLERSSQAINKDVMQMALLCAFDNIEVYTCLKTRMVQLPPKSLTVVSSRGSCEQITRLIGTLKDQKEWPPESSVMKTSLECSFYKPDVFNILMTEIYDESMQPLDLSSTFSILFACRNQAFDKVEEYVSELKRNFSWNPNDIVLKCSLLESSDDKSTYDLFKQNGVVTDDILDYAYKIGNVELQSYIIAYLTKKGRNVINFKTLNEDIIRSLSKYPALCSEQLLERAVEVCDKKTVLDILNKLRGTNSAFIESDSASDILNKCSDRPEIYEIILETGIIPTADSLFNVIRSGSFEIFEKTITLLNDYNRLFVTNDQARELVRESVKRSTSSFYTILAEHGIKARIEDITYALSVGNVEICFPLIYDLENNEVEECSENVDVIIVKGFQVYKILFDKGLQLTTSILLKVTDSYLCKHLDLSKLRRVYSDFFSKRSWSFEDDNLCKIWQMSKHDKDLLSVLNIYIKSAQEDNLLKVLMSRDRDELKTILNNESSDIHNVLPAVLRQAAISRKRLDQGCMQTIFKWIDATKCGPSLKILSSVLQSDTEGTLNILYELSQKQKHDLDNSTLETALEEAIFRNKPGIYCSILKECRIKPTTYCLLYSLYHNNDNCFNITLKKLPAFKKTCNDPYFKLTLALCCQRMDSDRFNALLNVSKVCDTELLFEAALCKNNAIFQRMKETLIRNNQWDFDFRDYWISSALIEANDNPSIKSLFESYYDDTVNVANSDNITPVSERLELLPVLESEEEENCEDEDGIKSENEYEELNSFLLHETAYFSLRHVQ